MATRGSENRFPGLTLVGQGSDPTTPSSGDFRLFVADDGTFYLMDDTGAKLDLTPSSGLTDPMTSRGDIIVRNASNVTARLAKGSADTYVGSDGTDVSYSAVTDAKLSTSDITTNNASTSKHGFLKKLSNSATDYMDGTGNWSTPSGGGGGSLTSSTAVVGSDVTLNTSTFTDVLSLTSLAAGTWLVIATLCAYSPSGVIGTTAKIWDGTNLFGSGDVVIPSTDYRAMLAIACVVVLGSTTTVKVSAKCVVGNGKILKDTVSAVEHQASNLVGIKIA